MTMQQDININQVISAIEDFDNSFAAFDKFVKLSEEVFGESWKKKIKENIVAATDNDQIIQKLNKIFNYESALNTWSKAQKFIKNPDEADVPLEFLTETDKWLPYFGAEGKKAQEAIHNLFSSQQNEKQKLLYKQNIFEHAPPPPQNLEQIEENIDKDIVWNFNNFLLLADYYQRTIARISARCVRMGNLTLEEYPYYNYILDLLDEICTCADKIIKHNELDPLINARIKGGKEALLEQIKMFKKEFDRNASPEMIRKSYNIEEIRKTMGKIDKSKKDDDVFQQQNVTKGAGESVDDVVAKLLKSQGIQAADIGEDKDLTEAPPPPPSENKPKPFSSKK